MSTTRQGKSAKIDKLALYGRWGKTTPKVGTRSGAVSAQVRGPFPVPESIRDCPERQEPPN